MADETRTVSTYDVKVGDRVGRDFGGGAFDKLMWLTVTEVDETTIHCNAWQFDRKTGAEIDHELRWGPKYGRTGSYIKAVKQAGFEIEKEV